MLYRTKRKTPNRFSNALKKKNHIPNSHMPYSPREPIWRNGLENL